MYHRGPKAQKRLQLLSFASQNMFDLRSFLIVFSNGSLIALQSQVCFERVLCAAHLVATNQRNNQMNVNVS